MSANMPTCGPFLSASTVLYSLSENLYQQRLLNEAIDMYTEYTKKIDEAVNNSYDEEYIANLKKESEYYDQIFELSITNAFVMDET